MRDILDKTVLASRRILTVFYLGLAAALLLYAVRFAWKLWKFLIGLFDMEDNDVLLAILYLVDAALVASLVVMIVVSSYDTFVSRLTQDAREKNTGWLSEVIDPGNLKIKLTTSIIAISSIHLLQIFLKAESFSDRAIMWSVIIQAVFLVGGLCLAVMDRLEGTTKALKKPAEQD